MSKERIYLVIGADRSVRAARRPRITRGEVAIPITLTFPDTWGRVLPERSIDVQVPDWTPSVEPDACPSPERARCTSGDGCPVHPNIHEVHAPDAIDPNGGTPWGR